MSFKRPYLRYLSYRRDMVIYGVCIHDKGRHYCFNRRYLVLPVQLPRYVLDVIKLECNNFQPNQRQGHGAMLKDIVLPRLLVDSKSWTTYMLFKDGSAPMWAKNSETIRGFLETGKTAK